MDDTTELSYEQLKPFRCKKCTNSFPTKHSLTLHINTMHSKGVFECRKCAFKCEGIGKMNFHSQRHRHYERHSITTNEKYLESPEEHKIQAKIPSLVIKLGKDRLHISQNSVNESQKGEQNNPNSNFDDEVKGQRHLIIKKTNNKSNGIFFCEICKKRFTQRGRFQKHMIMKHTEEKSVEIGTKLDGKHIRCLVCHKLFASKGTLKRHMLIHTGEMPFECTKCDAKFNQNIRLQQHMMKDHGEGMFKCNKCDESFIQSIHLERHLVAHTGKKPFSCKKCDASFAMHRDLKRHLILGHIQKKPFQCRKRGNKLILKRYVSKSMKKNHTTININITVNNSEKYLKCMKCKESVKFSQLKTHMDMHQNAYRCQNCNRLFSSKHSLKIHRAKAHRENKENTKLGFELEHENTLNDEKTDNQSNIDINQDNFKCHICNKMCQSMHGLNIHKARAHKEYSTGNSHSHIDQNDFKCEICNKICHSMHGLNIHKARAHKKCRLNTNLELEQEYKKTPSGENSENQTHIDIDQKDFICEICNKSCNSMHGLNIHKARAHKKSKNNTDIDLEPDLESEIKNTLSAEHTDSKDLKEYSNDIKMNDLEEMSSNINNELKDTKDSKILMQSSDLEDQKTDDKKWQVKSCEEGGKLKIKLQNNSRES
ncbi:unnamed protein product [Meganyctiphanes norvegica]|uniref:C2H2-type domain-containing protein n=1 Tax=Meganyctiphanes norvegica TaxID=48144 RepID=A0AAV2PN12_MEGNR